MNSLPFRSWTELKRRLMRKTREFRDVTGLPVSRSQLLSPSYSSPFTHRRDGEQLEAFSRGFLISSPGSDPRFVPEGWEKLQVADHRIWHDRRLPAVVKDDKAGESAVVILGSVVDSRLYTSDLSVVAEKLLLKLGAREGFSQFDDAVTWLGGRYVIVGVNRGRTRVHVDATASRSCFWAEYQNGFIAGSHSALVAKAIGEESRKNSDWVLSNPKYESPAGKWLPGAMTPHDEVSLVVANCCLEWGRNGVVHRRFFPADDYIPRKLPTRIAASEVRKELQIQFELGRHADKALYFGLTAGEDSRVLLQTNLSRLQELEAVAFTYHSFEKDPWHSRRDALAARKIAGDVNIDHITLDLRSSNGSQKFRRAYYETFTGWARFPLLAETFYRELSDESQIALAIGPEIGTVFYRDRNVELLNAAGLAGKYTSSDIASEPKLIAVFEDYLSYTDLDVSLDAPLSAFDLFYWESRLSNWAAPGYSEYEMAVEVILPFNSRTIIMPMLELPFPVRKAKGIYDYLLPRP